MNFLPTDIENIISKYQVETTHLINFEIIKNQLKTTLKNRSIQVEYYISKNSNTLEMWCYNNLKEEEKVTCVELVDNKVYIYTEM